jgi:hypothetical protein
MNYGYKIYKDKDGYVVASDGEVVARCKTEKECREIVTGLKRASERATEQINKILLSK